MKNENNHHGRNLKFLLQILGYPQRYIANKLNKKQQSISKFFKKSVLPDATITEIADTIEIDEKLIRENILEKEINQVILTHRKKIASK